MSYQPRLDQLESEVFQSGISSTIRYQVYLPYLLIIVVSLLSLYSFCPRSLQTKKNRQYTIRTDRFVFTWIIISFSLCAGYYYLLRKREESNTA